ncbi:hypothetical protein [Arthrospira platensis]|uniref:hypothetical protein n=1 Tax=Limnospira TaxID=2596745 RepID=UPI0003099CC2
MTSLPESEYLNQRINTKGDRNFQLFAIFRTLPHCPRSANNFKNPSRSRAIVFECF